MTANVTAKQAAERCAEIACSKRVSYACECHDDIKAFAATLRDDEGTVRVPKAAVEAAARKLALIGKIYEGDQESRELSALLAAANLKREKP